MPPTRFRAAIAVITILIPLTALAQPKREIDLRPRFEQGQEIRYEMRTEATERATLSKRAEDALDGIDFDGTASRTLQRMDLLLRVLDADPEAGATLEMVVESVAVTVESGGNTSSYDSRSPGKKDTATDQSREPTDSQMQARAMRTAIDLMVGSKATIKVDPSGRITSLNLPAALDQTGIPAVLGPRTADATAGSTAAGVPFGQIVSVGHPTGLVKLREEWTSADTISPLGLSMQTHHTLRTASAKKASVDMAGVLTSTSELTKILHADFEGSYDWDVERGELQKMDVRANIQVDAGLFQLTRSMTTGVRRLEESR
jgi:hypothetical protein